MTETNNLSQLRDDIDSGRTWDKVKGPDPAMAPLGTDEEAGGTPTPKSAIEKAARIERQEPAKNLLDPMNDRSSDFPFGLLFLSAITLASTAFVLLLIVAG